MATNLENQYIDESYQKLVQISGSYIADGTGSTITELDLDIIGSASYAQTASVLLGSIESASFATTASYAENAANAGDWDGQYSGSAGITGSLTFHGTGIVPTDIVIQAAEGFNSNFIQGVNKYQFDDNNYFDVTGNGTSYWISGSATAQVRYIINGAERVKIRETGAQFNVPIFGNVTGSLEGTASYSNTATSASHAVNADLAILATTATNSTYSDATIVNGKNLSGSPIAKGTPLYFTGSNTNGNLVGVWPADASNPARMPAPGIAGEDLAIGAEGVVLLDGFINGVDTSLFNAGDAVYVAAGGGYTNVRPTGSSNQVQALGYIEKVNNINGSGVIKGSGRANDIPNLQQGYFFVGGTGDVGTTVASSSFAKVAENNVFTGTQTFNNIAVNGTGSFAYIQSVTGSAKIIGDNYIILNNDTPTERYAGIVVQDSGSGSPLTTASLEFDGQSNDWLRILR